MIPSDFRDFFINSPESTQQEIVSSLLSLSLQESEVKDREDIKAISCPHCSDKRVRANGKLKGVQRYVCNGCKKNFSETTGKFWYNIKKKKKLNRYLYCLLSGYSIRKSAKETKISIQTSFDWRHKLLTSFSSVSAEEFKGIVESDDFFLLTQKKGIDIWIENPRNEVRKQVKQE